MFFDPKEVVIAICLSHVQDIQHVEELVAQPWVETWAGWDEIADDASDAAFEALGERFMRLAMEHAPSKQKSNAQRVRELHEQGLQLKCASSHGVNNCLIDALLLGLLDVGLVPGTASLSQQQRRHLCAACRYFLYTEHGTPARTYLDAHHDTPRILEFFLRKKWLQNVAVRVRLYCRFDHLDTGLEDNSLRWIDFHPGAGAAVIRCVLHIYNQTDANQRGYHFDALLDRRQSVQQHRSAESGVDSKDTRAPVNSRYDVPEASDDVQRPSKRPKHVYHDTTLALQTLRQNGWQLHPCSWPESTNSFPEALLLALSFHEWIPQKYGLLTHAAERQKACTAYCSVGMPANSGASAEEVLHCLEAAVEFLLKECQGDAKRLAIENLVIYVHSANARNTMLPAYTLHVGNGAALISTVLRLFEYDDKDHYDALLPAQATVSHDAVEVTGRGDEQSKVNKCFTTVKQDQTAASGWHSDTPPHVEQLRQILQRFCDHRGVHVQVNDADARRLQAAWSNRDVTGTELHTLLQAGLAYADAGMHHARRLVDQWRGFYTACTQGEGRCLGYKNGRYAALLPANSAEQPVFTSGDSHNAAQGSKQNDMNASCTTDAAATSEVTLSIIARKRQATQQDASASPSRKTEMNVPPRRVRHKAPPVEPTTAPTSGTGSLQDASINAEDIYPLRLWKPSQGNEDPRAAYDFAMQDAAALLSDKPTLPERLHVATNPEMAYDLPDYHCAFRSCGFECATQATLAEHVAQRHAAALHDLTLRWSSQVGPAQATVQAYQDLLTQRCQQSGPLATCSIDRRCLRRFRSNMLGHQVGTAICFVCARRFLFVDGLPNQQISWLRAYEPRTGLFFDHVPEMLEALLGMSTYHTRYVTTLPAETQPGLQSELAQWTCTIACAPYNMSVLACPEDKRCIQRCPSNRLCTHCEIPMCTSCRTRIYRQRMKPLEALSNDLFLGHPPKELYEQECTMLELLCASPCMTALTCFSIEWRYPQDRSLAQDALMNRHRLCAKGNATTFPLPWEDLLAEFERLGTPATNACVNMLPHVGKELSDKVAVIIKIGDKTDKEAIRQQIIHQAVVRRRVVVGLIAAMVARSHPAYQGLDMAVVETRAEMLPENDVPAEIIALLDNNGSLDQVLRQKAATPVNDQMTAEEARREFGHMLKPNAVVLEKTSAGCQDVNAQHVSALEEVVARAEPASAQPLPEVTLYTGTKLLDQFQPLYFALAFPFVFPYGIGLPDVPKWSQRQRPRRHADDPYVELNTWVGWRGALKPKSVVIRFLALHPGICFFDLR